MVEESSEKLKTNEITIGIADASARWVRLTHSHEDQTRKQSESLPGVDQRGKRHERSKREGSFDQLRQAASHTVHDLRFLICDFTRE